MSKLQRGQSQVSQDFSITLKAVMQTAIEKEKNQNDLKRLPDSISSTSIKSKKNRGSFRSINSRSDHTLRRQVSSNFSKGEKISLNRTFSKESQYEEKLDKPLIQPGVLQRNESFNSSVKKSRYFNVPNYIKSLFVANMVYSVPFESTSIYNLPFALAIILENQEKVYVNVRNYHTIDKIISEISKRKTLRYKEISLYYGGIRLESNATVSWYGIKSKSHIHMKILKKIKIKGRCLDKTYPLYIYTSEMIIDIKELFSFDTEIDSDMMLLTYNDITLEDTKYIFSYGIKEEGEINIRATTNENSNELPLKMNPGLDIVQRYIKMTNSLETCSCKERRQNEIAYIILSLFNKKFKRRANILKEFDKNFHHISCFKSKPNRSTCSSASTTSQSNESEVSSEDISLDDCILAEIQRVNENKKMIIEEKDIQFLCNAKSFKEFKHFLKAKIGTKSNLRSVAMLYKYALEMVVYIGAEEEENSNVKNILNNINLYFKNYFEKEIIAKGGMGGLALTVSDIED